MAESTQPVIPDLAGCACPLCGQPAAAVATVDRRPLWGCAVCDLRFVPASYHPSPEQERQRYALHQNTRANAGYVERLMGVVRSLRRRFAVHDERFTVLDFGCGPAPVLVDLLREAGFRAVGYDPYFAPDTDLRAPFDAVAAVETFEHFRQPAVDVKRAAALVKPGGFLLVMTALHDAATDWPRWHYARDLTHVAFYSAKTFEFIAARWALETVESDGRALTVLARPLAA